MCGVLLAGCGEAAIPRDRDLIARFEQNRAGFIALRDLAMQETRVVRIGEGFIWLENDFTPTPAEVQSALPPERMTRYKNLFKQLGLPTDISINRAEQSVCMYAYARGLAVSGSGKGYCWLAEPPERLLTVPLESWPEAGFVGGDFDGYREIEPGWYLHQDST